MKKIIVYINITTFQEYLNILMVVILFSTLLIKYITQNFVNCKIMILY